MPTPTILWEHAFQDKNDYPESVSHEALETIKRNRFFRTAAENARDKILNALDRQEGNNSTVEVVFDLPAENGGRWFFRATASQIPEMEPVMNTLGVTDADIDKALKDVYLR